MSEFATTKLSSKGQVVIPEDIRENLGLKEGTQFIVMTAGDSVILKIIVPPSPNQIKDILAKAKVEAKKAGVNKNDLHKGLARARKKT
ncbi:MAG: AbrB/MazE/SpoVT family DNA-binding domain-containing protein [Oligoflexales bacterium]|nr:AbrB/MazE/SpoVT family DNA-binding domain-containing protein [Oligoflexales bacterium]